MLAAIKFASNKANVDCVTSQFPAPLVVHGDSDELFVGDVTDVSPKREQLVTAVVTTANAITFLKVFFLAILFLLKSYVQLTYTFIFD
jgi:hypothetical protein